MDFSETISVVIPAYNAQDTLADCVNSVCAQTYPAALLEILIVDDGSSDDTAVVANALARAHANVRVLRQENGGASRARNRGIEASTGTYIGFVDSDDTIAPEMYETLMRRVRTQSAKIAQIARKETAWDGGRLPDDVPLPDGETVATAEQFLKGLLLHQGDSSFCTKLCEKALFTSALRFPEDRRNEDFHLLARLLCTVDRIAMGPERLYHVRHRAASGSRPDPENPAYFPPAYRDIVPNADEICPIVTARFPALKEVATRFRYAQRLDYLLHIPVAQMRSDNAQYRQIASDLRAGRKEIANNAYLTPKEKRNLHILSIAPKTARRAHMFYMRIK